MTEIYIIRHGEAEGNLYRRAQGRTQSRLTATGLLQAQAVKKRFENIHLDAAYSSTLLRAYMTGVITCGEKGIEVIPQEQFSEINLGVWEDHTWGEVIHDYPGQYDLFMTASDQWHVEGCEGTTEAGQRFFEAVKDVARRHQGQTIAVFAHGAVIRAFLVEVFRFLCPGEEREVGHSDNTGVTLLHIENDIPQVVYMYDNSHLGELSTYARHIKARREAGINTNLRFVPVDMMTRGEEYLELIANFVAEAGIRDVDLAAYTVVSCLDKDCVAFAFSDETLVGLVQLEPCTGEIKALYIIDKYRGFDLGVQLLGYAVYYYRRRGISKIIVEVPEKNVHVLKFFRKYEFIEIGQEQGNVILETNISFPDISQIKE